MKARPDYGDLLILSDCPVLRSGDEHCSRLYRAFDPPRGVTVMEVSVCVARPRACAILLRSAVPSRLALPLSPPPSLGGVLAALPRVREPQPYTRAPNWGRHWPGS